MTITVTERVPVVAMAGPATPWSMLDGHGRTLAVQPPAARAAGPVGPRRHGRHRRPAAGGRDAVAGGAAPAWIVGRTLPPAFAAQVVSVTVAADGTVSLALNSGSLVQLGTATT